MATKYTTNISTRQLNQLIRELQEYADKLAAKCEQFVSELAEIGIETARANLSDLVEDNDGNTLAVSGNVYFEKQVDANAYGATSIIIPSSNTIFVEWATGSAVVDPLLMAEFGSGEFAVEGHRGTFPNQKHAFDPNGWYWKDIGGKLHHSRGITPTRPLHKAKEEMIQQISEVAERVFEL